MDEGEMSSKDEMFGSAVLDLYQEIKQNQKKDKSIYTVPKVDLCNWVYFR